MRKSTKKLISAVLLNVALLSIILPCITVPVEAAGDDAPAPYYWLAKGLPKSVFEPIITRDMWNSTPYKNQLLKTDWGSNLVATANCNSSYNLNYGNYKSRLRYTHQYWHDKDEKTPWYANFKWDLSPYTKQLIANQELKMYLEARLAADNHNNFIHHRGEMRNDRAQIEVTCGRTKGSNLFLGGIMNYGTDADEVFYTHSEEFKLPECDYVNFTLGGNACGCGSSKVKNTIIALVDEKSPTVKEAKICDENGNPLNHISSGKKGRVAIVFSEPMRFADHDPKPYTINLDLYDRALEQSIATKLEATLVSLDKDTLYFEFEVPDKIGDEDTDVYIKSVSQNQPDTIFASDARFDLVSIAKYDRGNTIHTNRLDLNVGIENINRAKSAITDLAGNSVTWNKAVPVNKAFLDGLAPKVEGIELKLIDNKVPTYAGVGSKIVVTMFFSEKMKFLKDTHGDSKDNIKVTLNLVNNDVPIVLDFKEAYEVKNSVNRPAVTAVEFWPCEINSNLSLQTGDEKVKVAKIMLDRGVTDLSDNPVDKAESDGSTGNNYLLFINGDDIPIPDQEIRLDVTPPVVGGGGIVPTSVTDDGFTYLFDIADSGSKVTGKKGKFAWVDKSEYKDFKFNNVGKTFLYALSSDESAPEEEYFETGTISAGDNIYYEEFNQIEGNNYLHIKIEDASDILMLESELHIIAMDRLENESEVKELEIKEKFLSDKTPPTVEMGKHYFTIDGTDIELHVPVVVRDKTGVKEIYYKWKDNIDKAFGLENQSEVYASQSLTISKTVSQEVYGTDSLTVYAVDIADNSGVEEYLYEYDDKVEDENMPLNDKYHQKRNYNYNTEAPVSDLGPNQRDPKDLNVIGPSLFIDRPKTSGIHNNATTAIIVRNPFVVFENNIWEHFVYFLNSDEEDSLKDNEGNYIDFFEKYRKMTEDDWTNNVNLAGWYTGNFLKYEKLFHTKPLSEYGFNTSKDEPETSKEQFAAIFGHINLDKSRWHHYRDLEIRVITVAEGIDEIGADREWWPIEDMIGVNDVYEILAKDGIDFEKFPNKTYIKMRSADPLGIDEIDYHGPAIPRLYDGYKFLLDDYEEIETYTIDGKKVHWFRPDIHGTNTEYNKNKDLNEKPVTVSLEEANGLKIPFAFNDGHVIFDYDDIDETKSNLKLYYTGDQVSGINFEATEENLVYTAPIYAKYGTQYFTLSVNQENVKKFKTGYYALVASMATKSKGVNNETFSRQDLLVSDLFIDAYAPAKDDFILSLQGSYGDKNRGITTSATGQLVGSVGSGMDWKINIEQKGTESQLIRNNETYYSYPNLDAYKIDMDGMYWIKVWNPDVKDSEENAKWQYYTKDYKLEFIDNSDDTYTVFDNGVAYAPVINGEKNIMQYQFCSYNGVPGSTGQFTLLAGDVKKKPSFETWCSHEEDTPAKSVVIGPTDIETDNFIEGYGLLIKDGINWRPVIETEALLFTYEEMDENDDTVIVETMNYVIFQNGNYKYYIYDDYGMTGEEEIEIKNIDTTEPTIAISGIDFANGILKFTATVTDDYSLDGGSLLVKFGGGFIQDSHLKNLDRVDETEDSDVYITIPLDSQKVYQDAFRKAGVYKLTVEDADDGKEKTINIEMVIGNVPKDGSSSVSLNAIDSVGNIPDSDSSVKTWSAGAGNDYAPAIIEAEWKVGESMVYLNFNTPVKLLSHNLADSDYGISVPTTIYSNGIYTIEYTDVFGDTYSEFIEIDLTVLDLGLDIQYDKALTKENIELKLKTSDSSIKITEVKIGSTIQNDLSLPDQELEMTITENCIIYVTITKDGGTFRTQAISIDNIDKTQIEAKLIWIYEEGNWTYEEGNEEDIGKDIVGETTTAPVSVTVVGNKPLIGDLTYTFANGATKNTTHTFTYSDEVGNTGSITATLRHNINFTVVDKLAPGVDIKVYFKTFEAYNQGLSGSAGNFNLSNIDEKPPVGIEDSPTNYSEETGSPIDWNDENDINNKSQAVRMDLKITDQSATKVFIKSTNSPPQYSDAASNKVDKAELIGNSIFIDTTGETDITPQDFYIFVVDEKNNWTSFLVKPGLLDKTAPEIEDIYVKLHDPFRAEAILKIAEKDADDTTVTNRTGIVKYDDSTYGYMTGSNETVTFYYHDSVGNSGERSIQTTGLDTYAPELIGLTWSPQGTGAGDIQSPPEGPIKGSLLAQLTIKNLLSSVKLINNDNKDIKLSFTDKKINLIFNENAEVTLEITSPNGNILPYTLNVSCLDNGKLEINRTNTKVAKNQRSAVLTFESNKDAFFVEGKHYVEKGKPFAYTVASAKPIKLNFTDKVGNVAIVDIKEIKDSETLKKLDFSPLKLQFNTTNNDIDAVDKLSDLYKDSIGENLSIYVKSSHIVTVEGANVTTMPANTWTPITLKKVDNKATLKFTDERGDSFSTAAYFKIPDEVPPVILLKETVISVAKDIATKSILKDLIEKAIMVSDNVSKVDGIEVTINIDNVNLKVLGIYTATITAKDEAGKTSTKDIQIRVAPAEGLLAQIGSRFLEPNGTHILYGDSLKFSLMTQDREEVKEPYKIYVKEELQTPGQMKSAERFFSDDENSEQEIKFTTTGLHTIYIQTQNRYNYIFYVYVMD